MERISEILEIPKFIEYYINYSPIEPNMVDYYTHMFCEFLLSHDFKELVSGDNGKSKLIYNLSDIDLDSKDSITFVNFYLNKSILDPKLVCEYEEETCIPKSLVNEVFKVVLYDKEYYIYIEKYTYSELSIIVL